MIVDTLRDAPAPFKGTEIHTLQNGLKIILKEDHTIPVVSIQAWARCGAIDESPNIYGISHGLEHMVFKGTPTRSAGEISRAIESNGGVINAATQLETTHYYVEVPSYGAETALNVLIDTIMNPTFPQEELERERLVILEEIHRREDSPEATLWDEFTADIFKDTPYAIKVIGSEKTVSALSREDLNTYYKDHYVPSKKIFVVVGDFDKKSILKKLKESFEQEPAKKPPESPIVKLDNWTPTTRTIYKSVEMGYVAAGFPSIGFGDKDVVGLDILSDVLCGGSSSRMYQNMREELQVVLDISCDFIPFKQKGLFAFFIDTLPQKTDQAIKELFNQIESISKKPITIEELNRAKARTKSEWLMGSETPRGIASTLGSLGVLGHIDIISTYLKRVETMTVKDLMGIYENHLRGKKLTITKLIPYNDKKN